MIYTNTDIKKAGHNWYQTDKKSVSEHKKMTPTSSLQHA